MAKTALIALTNDEYVAELNRRLEANSDYRPGARFVARPAGLTFGGGGVTWEGPSDMRRDIVRIVKETAGLYELDKPFSDRRDL
jgi:hypothetical protein